jgi:hypothetical protein
MLASYLKPVFRIIMNMYVNDHDWESYIKLTCDVSLKNYRYFRDNEPEVLIEISKLIDDVDRPITKDCNSLFWHMLCNLVKPLAYSVPYIALGCMPLHLLYMTRLIIESLMAGLYEDFLNGGLNIDEKLKDTTNFRMPCGSRAQKNIKYKQLKQGINRKLNWLGNELGIEPMDFICNVYYDLSKAIHPITKRSDANIVCGALVIALTAFASGTPTMRAWLQPAECEGDVEAVRYIYTSLIHMRLSINMLVYVWGSLVGKLSSEELEGVRRRIEDAVKAIRQI